MTPNDYYPPDQSTEADLFGLPSRGPSHSREPMEEAASEYVDALRRGEAVDPVEFAKRYPRIESELVEFLPLIGAMEDWKAEKELEVIKTPMPKEFQIERLGDCRIIREIARGGMGVVFEAEQEPIARRVAVKLLPWKFGKDSKWGNQFLREARTAARLTHPNIVPVFQFGEHEGRYYYVMPLIEGVGLDHLIAQLKDQEIAIDIEELIEKHRGAGFGTTTPFQTSITTQRRLFRKNNWLQIAKLATQIAGTLRYAHRQGTLHRDIKPANLLIDRSGKGWIADFGLALGREHALALQGNAFAGTLRYMAPEQLDGVVTEQTDLYSFGATLYELCTLQPAIEGVSRTELAAKVQKSRIVTPRSVNPEIPQHLEAIILQLIRRDPAKRYRSAEQVYRDLLKLVSLWSASQESMWTRVKKWF